MSELTHERIIAGISAWRAEQPQPLPAEPRRRDFLAGETWEEKYDRLHREMKPREQFGKTFSARFDWRKSA